MVDDEEPQKSAGPASPSMPVLVGAMVGLTLVAAAAGASAGFLFAGKTNSDAPVAGPPPGSGKETKYGGEISLLELPPVIANLAEPSDVWVRVQASIVFDGKSVPKPDVVAAEIAEDMLGFMRTLSVAQIGGASGLQHLREDLSERASIRSGGLVRELIIQTLVVQ
jgi:flagellar protein FliL